MNKEELLSRAESGEIQAMEEVADSLYRGKNTFEQDRVAAAKWYQKLLELESDNLVGLNGMGNCNYYGYGVPVDAEKGAAFYLRAAELGYSKSQYNIASYYQDKGDSRCVDWYTKAFENGEYDSAAKLGEIYADGTVVPQDYAKAIEWFTAGAEKGDDASALHLACEYLSGEHTQKDGALALKWMLASAEAGNSAAMNNLAIMYSTGDCVAADYDAGLEWAIKGCQAGDASQLVRYAAYFDDGDGFLPHDPQKGTELFMMGAEAGDKACMRQMAIKYFQGDGVEKDEKKSLHYAEAASRKGETLAMDILMIVGTRVYGEEAPKHFFEVVKAGADDGYYECMVRVYECYKEGHGVEKNDELALKYLREASEDDFSKALFFMGNSYMSGELVGKIDYQKGLECYRKIVAKGKKDKVTAATLRNLGYAYKDATGVEKDLERAIEYFEAAAEMGNQDAMLRAGLAHDDGGWATPDYAKAAHFYQELAETGDPNGMFLLAIAYDEGKGVDVNKQKAFELHQKAAEKDFAPSLVNLGFAYYGGEVVPKDLKKVVECWERAASLGHEKAQDLMGKVNSDPEFAGVVDHEKFADQLLEKAQAGEPMAMYQLAEKLSDENKFDESKEWMRKAAEAGVVEAQFDIGCGAFLHEDYEEAVKWLAKGVEAGHAGCLTIMADMLINGKTPGGRNEAKGFECYQKAAAQGNLQSMYQLGRCYYTGRGTAEDHQKAFEWFDRARQGGCNEMWFELGNCYWRGHGVAEDLAKAVEMFKTGIEKQHCKYCQLRMGQISAEKISPYYNPSAAIQYLEPLAVEDEFQHDVGFALGVMYSNLDDGVNAVKWLEIAATKEHAVAQYNLGVLYFNGQLVAKDLSTAEYYFSCAARNGYPNAAKDAEDCRKLIAAMQQRQSQPQSQPNQASSSSGGGCYVATAVYGSYDCPEVWTLRRFRDYTLAETWYGRVFIKVYYAVSPTLVAWFGETKWFKRMWKGKLDRMVKHLQDEGVENTPYNDPMY